MTWSDIAFIVYLHIAGITGGLCDVPRSAGILEDPIRMILGAAWPITLPAVLFEYFMFKD